MVGVQDMEVCFLGTSSAQPSPTRNVSALTVRLDGVSWLFDCGEGTQQQILRSQNVRLSKIQCIFITHLHGDHVFGLPGLLCTMSGTKVDQETALVEIVGPCGIREYIRTNLRLSASMLNYGLRIIELCTAKEPNGSCDPELNKLPYEVDGINLLPESDGTWNIPVVLPQYVKSVRAANLSHTVPCVGFVVEEDTTPGSLDVKLVHPPLLANKERILAEMKVKNPLSLIGRLVKGETLTLPDGTVLRPEDVMGPPKPGRKLVILGDTCNSDDIKAIAADCDILVHEATNCTVNSQGKSEEEVRNSTIEHGHSTPQMAAMFAEEIRARTLLLTHFSARYPGDQEPESLEIMQQIVSLAQEKLSNPLEIVPAYDFMVRQVKRKA